MIDQDSIHMQELLIIHNPVGESFVPGVVLLL